MALDVISYSKANSAKAENANLNIKLNYYLYDYCNNDGITPNDTSLTSLITTIGSNPATIIISHGTYAIATNFSFPLNIRLKFERGGMISVADTKVLTILGEIVAGNYQIFAGLGTVNKTLSPTPYNICWYEGVSLPKKWNKMSVNFTDKITRIVNIPKAAKDQDGCIKGNTVQERWGWWLDESWIINDNCSNITINLESEIMTSTNIGTGIIIGTTATKIENISFPFGIVLTAHSVNRLTTGIEVRGCARLHINGRIDINFVDNPMILGGDNQAAPVGEVNVDAFHCGYSKNAITLYGKNDSLDTIRFNDIKIDEILENGLYDAVTVKGLTRLVTIKTICYSYRTDPIMVKNMLVVQSTIEGTPMMTKCGILYGPVTGYGVFTQDLSSGTADKIEFLDLDTIRTSNSNNGAKFGYTKEIYIGKLSGALAIVVDSDSQWPVIKTSNRNRVIADASQSAIINSMWKKAFGVGVLPDTMNCGIGIIAVNASDNKVYLKHQHTGVNADDFILLN